VRTSVVGRTQLKKRRRKPRDGSRETRRPGLKWAACDGRGTRGLGDIRMASRRDRLAQTQVCEHIADGVDGGVKRGILQPCTVGAMADGGTGGDDLGSRCRRAF